RRFRFPDTDGYLAGLEDDVTLTGPATIAVTHRADAFPCAVATTGCAGQAGSTVACIDQLLSDGTCAAIPDTQFSGFTALPPANDYAQLCSEPAFPDGPCTGTANHT